jgi:two-component system nitrogen regulation sensor histidine kinase NtrY
MASFPATSHESPAASHPPFKDNPRLILAGIALLAGVLVLTIGLARHTSQLAPDFLTEVVLYSLSAADVTILVVFVLLLVRNIVKLLVERRRGLPFARFRSKLVALLLAMTLVPSALVLIVGSELIRASVDRWFNAPMDEVLSAANQMAGDYYHERQLRVQEAAGRVARQMGSIDLASAEQQTIDAMLAPEVAAGRAQMLELYRPAPDALSRLARASVAATPALRSDQPSAEAARLAAQAFGGAPDAHSVETLPNGGDLLHAAASVRSKDGRVVGVLVATDYLNPELATRSRRMARAFEDYTQLKVLKVPLTGVYLSFFLMVTLLILFGATWMGSYLAKRITLPVQMLSAAAKEIGAGRLDQRVEPQSADEFGALVESFNTMASELATSRRRVDRSTIELERKAAEVEGRRRYIETILERITTGVVSVDAAGKVTTINSAAGRLLSLQPTVVGQPFHAAFDRPDLQPLRGLVLGAGRAKAEPPQEISIAREGQDLHLAVVATPLVNDAGVSEGVVLVLDDVTPLIRAQKIAAWREVARRLAHEIKNPLTPIQLCAERLRRHFAGAPPASQALLDECTTTIVGEVESLKGLVDEFSQFARMPAPRAVPTDLGQLLTDTLALYSGIFTDVGFEEKFAPGLPLVRLDPEQIKRVIINLIDNAVEAMERKGRIAVETSLDPANGVVRIIVADDGPGIPPSEREKLFLPYYSTKHRGSGLGLAIVRRIIAEHGGAIEVGDNLPHGTRFTIELPA